MPEERMMEWHPIETAEKGGGAELVTDPAYVKPPTLLLAFDDGSVGVGYWDWYYAEGGNGYDGTPWRAWVEPVSGERYFTKPTHWMPVPPPPESPSR